MIEHPAFVCAREGHIPTFVLRCSLPQAAYICPCARCHRIVEFPMPVIQPVAEEAGKQTTGTDS